MKKIILLLTSIVLSLILISCTSTVANVKAQEAEAAKLAADVKAGGYKLIATTELKKMIDEKQKVLIISALPVNDDKSSGIIPSAVNGEMPKSEKDLTPAQKENLLKAAGSDKNKTIVVYCGFTACRRSHIGASILVAGGYRNIYRYAEGIKAWTEKGYTVNK